MPRKPKPVYARLDPGPADLSPEDAWAEGALQLDPAAAFLGVSRSSLKRLLRAGKLPSKLVCGRRVVPRRALRLYLACA